MLVGGDLLGEELAERRVGDDELGLEVLLLVVGEGAELHRVAERGLLVAEKITQD